MRIKAWLLTALLLLCLDPAKQSLAQCSGAPGIPFNCAPGAAIGSGDIIMGGQNSRSVYFTAPQLAAFAAGSNQAGVFNTLTVANGGSLSGIFFGNIVFAGSVTFNSDAAFTVGLNLGVTTAPATPNNYDVWGTSNAIFARLNGSTYQVAMTTTGGVLTGTPPIVVNNSAISCPSCATTPNGGAISGVNPIAVSASGAISMGNVTGGAVVQWDSSVVVPAATYYLPPATPWGGTSTITSVRFVTGGASAPQFTGAIQINNTAVTCGSSSSFTVTTTVTTLTCTGNNTFTNGQAIEVITSQIVGSPSAAYIQVNYSHPAV